MALHPYQKRAVEHVLCRLPLVKTLLVVSPVATGKTEMFSALAKRWARAGKRVLVLVHREELLKQAQERLLKYRVKAGIIWRDFAFEVDRRVQVSMIQTLAARESRPDADIVIVDEAHHSPSDQWNQVVSQYPMVVGFTATPVRDGGQPIEGYAELFEALTIGEGVRGGFLCPMEMKVYRTEKLELDQVGRVGKEFNQGELGKAMSRRQVVGDIVDRWQAHAKGRSTLVFAATVAQSKGIVKAFRRAGVVAYHLDHESPDRAEVLERFDAGEFPVLCNVDLFGEGTDIPRVKCIVLARPTHSLSKYLQQVGRGRRPWPTRENTEKCLVLDHSGLLGPHGHPDDDRDWTIGGAAVDRTENVVCTKCHTPRKRGTSCPNECVFEARADGTFDVEWMPHGYEYDAEKLRAGWEEKKREAIRLVRAGLTVMEAAHATGLSKQVVHYNCRLLGLAARAHKKREERISRAIALYQDGRSCAEIARELHVGKFACTKWIARAGITRSLSDARRLKTGMNASVVDQIVALYKRGMSPTEIAPMFGITAGSVLEWCRKSGVVRTTVETKRMLTKHQRAQAKKMRRSGASWREIGHAIGVRHTTAKKWVVDD